MKPKPKQDPVAEEELEMPPMPVPDYTLHFGKMARPVTSKWSDDGESSTAPRVADLRGTSASGVDRSNSCKHSTWSQGGGQGQSLKVV
jgi:hypothetical protein